MDRVLQEDRFINILVLMQDKKRWRTKKTIKSILSNTNHKVTRVITHTKPNAVNRVSDKYDVILTIGFTKPVCNEIKRRGYKNLICARDGLFLRHKKYDDNYPFYLSPSVYYEDNKLVYDETLPPDRWNNLVRMGEKVKPWDKTGKLILIGYQFSDAFCVNRLEPLKKTIINFGGNNIIFKPYPMSTDFTGKYGDVRIRYHPRMGKLYKMHNKNSLNRDFSDAKCMVTVDSALSVDAILFGVPVILLGRHHPAVPMSSPNVDNLKYPDREKWLNWMGYQHWSFKDMRSDKWIEYYRRIGLLKF